MRTQSKHRAPRSMPIALGVVLITAGLPHVTPLAITEPTFSTAVETFERVATYDVPGQVAEIIASAPDGRTLVYAASASEAIGFVTIAEPRHPTNGGTLKMPGPPTLVAVTPDGAWAEDTLLVVERDNQQRDDAQVKRFYSVSVSVSVAGITLAAAGETPPVLAKTLARDLLVEDDYRLEKIEGAALTKSGILLMVNDNDGAGKTRLLRRRGVISRHPPL